MESANGLLLARRPGHPPASGAQLAGAALSFTTVTYLALSDGGYGPVARNQVGLLIWWVVLLAAVIGVLPRGLGRAGWLALISMLGFVAWTGASIAWSVSAERSADELGMVTTYAGVLLLALTVQGRSAARQAVGGAAAAVGLIGVLAVLSRLHPAWFPADPQTVFLGSARRLSYPLGYWNGLAAFLAMGVVLLLSVAGGARRIAVQAPAAACIPALVLGIYLTGSRGGVIALGVALAAYLLLAADRLAALATVAVTGAGSALLVAYAARHSIIRLGVDTPPARHVGDRTIVVVALVCAGVAVSQAAIGMAARRQRPPWLQASRRGAAARIAAVLIALIAGASALGAPGRVAHDWRAFKAPNGVVAEPGGQADLFSRLSSAAGNGRYEYWIQAAKADQTRPLTGIGAGTFALWWSAHATTSGHITDAHSLYLQTLAETGIVGLVLIGVLLLTLLGTGIWRALRAPPRLRASLAGAAAALLAFATAAAYEWVWQLGSVAVLALILGAVCVIGDEPASTAARATAGDELVDAGRLDTPAGGSGRWRPVSQRGVVVLGALAALIAVGLPLAAARDLAQSQSAVRRGDLPAALADARAADRVQPYSASARLEEALVLEHGGDLRGARDAVLSATRREATNWQSWLVLARIESELGQRGPALAAFARARSLDPLGPLFSGLPAVPARAATRAVTVGPRGALIG